MGLFHAKWEGQSAPKNEKSCERSIFSNWNILKYNTEYVIIKGA